MEPDAFLDTNVLLRQVLQDHLATILSFDRKLRRVEGITREEPQKEQLEVVP